MVKNSLNHVALILDGNGRWALSHNKPRIFGHQKGVEVINNLVTCALEDHVKFLTLFCFSVENWNRPEVEVKFLNDLFYKKIISEKTLDFLMQKKVRFKWLGFKNKMSKEVLNAIKTLENKTAKNNALTLTIAFNYGGKQDLDSKQRVSSFLPDVDLLIRTGNEHRISNFLLYHLAYAEFIFEKTFWPNYTKKIWKQNLNEYHLRKRRFGSIKLNKNKLWKH